jgi:hypothetical protein
MREDLPDDGGIVQRRDQAQPAPTMNARQDINGERPMNDLAYMMALHRYPARRHRLEDALLCVRGDTGRVPRPLSSCLRR